MQTVLGWSLVI